MTNQRHVVEDRAIWNRLSAADQAAKRWTAKLGYLLPDELVRLDADRGAEGVESPDFQLFSWCFGNIFVGRSHREIRELLNDRHVLRALQGAPQTLSCGYGLTQGCGLYDNGNLGR